MKTLTMLRWYDNKTEILVDELEIKNISLENFGKLLNTNDFYGGYPLSEQQILYIRSMNEFHLDMKEYEYFIEFVGDYVLDLRDCTWIPATDETRKPSVEPVKTHQDKKEKK